MTEPVDSHASGTSPSETVGTSFPPRDFDGIGEDQHPVPRWWKWIFIGTIVFSFFYFGYYHFGGTDRGIVDAYEAHSAEIARMQFAEIGELRPDRATLVRFLNQPQWLSIGRSVYRTHCASCHGDQGQGLVGPNLVDDHYKNVTEIEDLLRVINKGAGAGAMPPWEGRLEENERIMVASFVASLRGTTPSAPIRVAEGREIDPWPTPEEIEAEAAGEVEESGAAEDEGTEGTNVEGTEESGIEVDAAG